MLLLFRKYLKFHEIQSYFQMESNYIKCSVSQPRNSVKQHGLRALLLGFFDCGFTLFMPRLKQLPILLKKGCFQTLLPWLKQTGHARLTTRSIYLFSFQCSPAQHIWHHVLYILCKKLLSSTIMALKTQTLPHNDKVSTLAELLSLLHRPHPTHQSLAWLNPVEKQ